MNKLFIPIIFLFIFGVHSVSAQIVGETLTGHYTYSDPEGDPEGISTFQWYRDSVAIPGATSITYLTTSLDEGKTIVFEVTPVSLTGISPGTPIRSTGILISTTPSPTTRSRSGGYLPGYGPNPTILTPQPTSPSIPIITTTPPPTFTKTLKPKTTHPDIKILQIYLNTHGYPVSLSGPGSRNYETSYFGPATKASVMKFQKANGLRPDGIVGEKTKGKMREV